MKGIICNRKIKVGVVGAFRGDSFAGTAAHTGMELVAVCDSFEYRLKMVSDKYGVAGYQSFDEFLKHGMDAVVIATPFHLHAPFAVKAMESGLHVLSETSCNITLAEGVELYRKAQETQMCYMLAENYCYTRFNQEMKRLYDADEIGEVRYAEGEYNHPMEPRSSLVYTVGYNHWRNQLPSCYYNTHALAPMMYITGTMPVAVSCVTIPRAGQTKGKNHFVMLVRMDNGAVFRIIGGGIPGHSNYYRFHGSSGAMENTRGPGYFGPETVRVWHEPWSLKEGQKDDVTYLPEWPSHGRDAEATGHGGGDFFVEHHFAEAIRTGVQPFLDARRGITMTNVGILAWFSANHDGAFLPIPDIASEEGQAQMLGNRLSPVKGVANAELMPPEMRVQTPFSPERAALAREVWKELGYTEVEVEELLKVDD